MKRLVLALLLFAAVAHADTWTATRPRTGSPCESWEWRAYDPSGFMFFHALTPDSTVVINQGDWASRTKCRCFDFQHRSAWSPMSATHIPRGLWNQWAHMGVLTGKGGL